jgi:hypothetical protein
MLKSIAQKIMVQTIFELTQVIRMIYTKGNQNINFNHVVKDHELTKQGDK